MQTPITQLQKQTAPIASACDDIYQSSDGHLARREYGLTPNGNPLQGYWVLRDAAGAFLDFNRYRHDLFGQNGLCMHRVNG